MRYPVSPFFLKLTCSIIEDAAESTKYTEPVASALLPRLNPAALNGPVHMLSGSSPTCVKLRVRLRVRVIRLRVGVRARVVVRNA